MGLKSIKHSITHKLRIQNVLIKHFLAEFLGTFLLVSFGVGVNGQVTLGRGAYGDWLSVNFGWGWAVAMGVWASIGVSGGHLNPAVSFAMCVVGRLSFGKMLLYWTAQYIGAFVASSCIFGIYYDALNNFDGGVRQVYGENATAGIWATYPQSYLSTASGFGDQTFSTMLLVLCIMAMTDKRNCTMPSGVIPVCVGIVVLLIGISFGLNCGYAINPARDLGPRLFTLAAGWGTEVFTAYDYWFWVPLVAPHVGAVCGVLMYLVLVGIHLDKEEDELSSIIVSDEKHAPGSDNHVFTTAVL